MSRYDDFDDLDFEGFGEPDDFDYRYVDIMDVKVEKDFALYESRMIEEEQRRAEELLYSDYDDRHDYDDVMLDCQMFGGYMTEEERRLYAQTISNYDESTNDKKNRKRDRKQYRKYLVALNEGHMHMEERIEKEQRRAAQDYQNYIDWQKDNDEWLYGEKYQMALYEERIEEKRRQLAEQEKRYAALSLWGKVKWWFSNGNPHKLHYYAGNSGRGWQEPGWMGKGYDNGYDGEC